MNKISFIPKSFLSQISKQAESEYPNECCGVILGPEDSNRLTRVKICRNAQDEYHGREPEIFKRTAAAAYFIDPQELLALHKEMRTKKEAIRIIYHSHINASPLFSQEDKKMALSEGLPVYPGVDYLILSVFEGKAQEMMLYHWDPSKGDFCPSPI